MVRQEVCVDVQHVLAKKNSKPKTTVNNAHLSVANIQGA